MIENETDWIDIDGWVINKTNILLVSRDIKQNIVNVVTTKDGKQYTLSLQCTDLENMEEMYRKINGALTEKYWAISNIEYSIRDMKWKFREIKTLLDKFYRRFSRIEKQLKIENKT